MTVSINSQFDGGNMDIVDVSDHQNIQLKIRADAHSEFLQWFYFSASGIRDRECTFSIVNAGQTSYSKGWEGYDVVSSYDRQHWFRTPANYDGQTLSWSITATSDSIWFAYFAPYSYEQHLDLIARSACARAVEYRSLGLTHLGRCIDYLKIGAVPGDETGHLVRGGFNASINASDKTVRKQLWVIGRQHPGESMAQWWMQGWLERLLDETDATSRGLRRIADIHVVPNMNPDGAVLGHLRTNALGVNLNREWSSPSRQRSPEVFFVRQQMVETGVDLSLDVHGDEVLPYNFIAGTEGIEDWNSQRDAELIAFKQLWASLNPDFQYQHGYPRTPPGHANTAICSSNLAATFGCLSMTLEMPFKDTANTPSKAQGWSPERSMRLGASFVDVAYIHLNG